MKYKLLFLFIFLSLFTFSQVRMAYDINSGIGSSNPTQLRLIPSNTINGSSLQGLFFSANNGTNGIEPYMIHNQQSMLVADINPGVGGSNPEGFTFYNNEFYFTANNPSIGKEPWKGLTSATSLKNIRSGSANSTPLNYHVFNNELYFTAFQDATGRELWVSDGTNSGTNIFKDINLDTSQTGTESSNPESFIELNGLLYFVAKSTVSSSEGMELYVTDGTANGTSLVKDINPNDGSFPIQLTAFNNKIYFSANNGANGRELWVSDGTASGTQLIDINPGANNSSPRDFTVFDNKLFFVATHGSLGEELFYINSSGNHNIFLDINNGSSDASPKSLKVFNNKLYFSANDGTNGVEIWSTDGDISTTQMIKNINLTGDSFPDFFTEYNNKLYFNANDGINGKELWVTDGTATNTVLIEDINTSGDSDPLELIVVNNDLFFTADNGTNGREIFKFYDVSLNLDKNDLLEISMYPNPTKRYINISTNLQIDKVIIFNLQGKIIKKHINPNLKKIDLKGISKGHYFLKIVSSGKSITQKIILN